MVLRTLKISAGEVQYQDNTASLMMLHALLLELSDSTVAPCITLLLYDFISKLPDLERLSEVLKKLEILMGTQIKTYELTPPKNL